MKPRATAEAQAPFTRKRGAITGWNSRPRQRDIPSSTTREDSTKKGKREGRMTLPQRERPSFMADMASPGQRTRARAAHRAGR